MQETKIIKKNWDKINPNLIDSYLSLGGYETLKRTVLKKKPKEIVQKIKASGLKGRGGGGFLTGKKWELAVEAAKKSKKAPYFVVNADESQPGTFKDMTIIAKNPHLVLEGAMLAGFAIGAKKVFIYVNGEYKEAYQVLTKALDQAYEKKMIGKKLFGTDFCLDVKIFKGAGGYICGEETALLSSLESKRAEPRIRPPFPTEEGYLDNPSVVNNLETVSNIVPILEMGGEEYRKFGTKDSPGTKLYCVLGSVKNKGLYEAPLGINVRELIHELSGGIKEGKRLNFVQIGGPGNYYKLDELNYPLVYEKGKDKIWVGLGDILVFDQTLVVEDLILSWAEFFKHESCGKCAPCREGSFQLYKIARRIKQNRMLEKDYDSLVDLTELLSKATLCTFGCFVSIFWQGVFKLVDEDFFKNKLR
jgi:NADH:ubiquinone oxidoreductase subunit F (NADH-binding)